MTESLVTLPKSGRSFLPATFRAVTWNEIEPWLQQILDMPLHSPQDVETCIRRISELERAIGEERAWRYIRMTCNTEDETLREAFTAFIRDIMPPLVMWFNKLDRKLNDSAIFHESMAETHPVLVRTIRNQLALFREENVALQTEIATLSRQFDQIAGSLFVEHEGQKYTMQQAGALLENPDPAFRETIGRKIMAVRFAERERLHTLYSKLAELRTQMAHHAGFDSYADYKHQELDRFDYTRQHCFEFHQAIEDKIRPLYEKIMEHRRKALGREHLRQWDLATDPLRRPPLRPFRDGKDLIEKTISLFQAMNPALAECLITMRDGGYLDLDSRLGKSPGGYNYGLPETGIPFVFMNAAGQQSDVSTILHEAGHAFHSFAIRDIPVSRESDVPSEVAELASMSMELITLDYLHFFYENPADHRRARREQLTRSLTLLPWIAAIDCFQHWVYDHPGHSHTEREDAWRSIYRRFHGQYPDWTGMEADLGVLWQKQGHVFDIPFYYIEYGIAQLGAIAVYRNYRRNPEQALRDYLRALRMGYTRPIPEVYAAAGVRFDFSGEYLGELSEFMMQELDALDD